MKRPALALRRLARPSSATTSCLRRQTIGELFAILIGNERGTGHGAELADAILSHFHGGNRCIGKLPEVDASTLTNVEHVGDRCA